MKKKAPPAEVEREGDGRWKPGVSPNPGGRPKVPDEVKDYLRAQTLPNLKALVELRDNLGVEPKDRIAAVKTMLAHTLPKPKDEDGELTAERALEILATALKG